MSDNHGMRDKLIILYSALILLGLTGFTIVASSGKIYVMQAGSTISDDVAHVEDALLVDTLEMNSVDVDNMVQDEESIEGAIIYDDSFIEESETSNEKKSNTSVTKSANSSEALISKLKKEDIRWHISTHTIKKGENLWSVARKYGSTPKLIISYNNIKKPDHVRPGTKVGVPNKRGYFHTVKKGETLSEIAVDKKVSQKKLKQENKIGNKILIGQKIFLPDAVKPVKKIIPRATVRQENLVANNTNEDGLDSLQESTKRKKNQTVKRNLAFRWPLKGQITSGFGMRTHPITGKRQFHNGIDIRAAMETPVLASEAGTVIYSDWKNGYGRLVVVKHKNNYISVYAHLSKYVKQRGQKVKRGEIIARSGNSGLSTGPHLHFEIRKYETPLNPLRML